MVQDVIITESFVCQIRSQRHIEVRALEGGYLSKIWIKEGQAVKEGDVMFKILPILYKARLDAEVAEAELARLKWMQTKKLHDEECGLRAGGETATRPNWRRPRPRRSWRRPN